uniref:Odorant receptor n=1 Tax=Plutella xylostella TaxID=51655 RepID=N0A395_PLUXY|nr:odorant receptor 1 [Plutella xylostella]
MRVFFLTDGSDLEGVEKLEDIKHIKVVKWTLTSLNSWPHPPHRRRRAYVEQFFLNLQSFLCIPFIVIYLLRNTGKKDFFRMGHVWITFFMNIVASTRLLLPLTKNYQTLTKSFIEELHLFYHRHTSEYSMKIHLEIHKLSHFFTMYLTGMMVGGIVLFNATPLANNIFSGAFKKDKPPDLEFEHAVYYGLPFDSETKYSGYIPVFLYNWFISYFCSSCFCIYDLILSLLIFHLWGHLKILNYNMRTFPRPGCVAPHIKDTSRLRYDDEEMVIVGRMLREQIDYHRFISDFSDHMSATFGPMLAIYYSFHQVSGCLLLLECSQLDADALIRYGPLTVILFQQLIQLSIVFELIGSSSEKLKDSVYSMPWECLDDKNRKILLIFLKKVQTPIHLKAMGIADIGVQTMAGIIKTSLSYFAFLRSK